MPASFDETKWGGHVLSPQLPFRDREGGSRLGPPKTSLKFRRSSGSRVASLGVTHAHWPYSPDAPQPSAETERTRDRARQSDMAR